VLTHEEQMVAAMREHHDQWIAERTTAQAEAAQSDKPAEALKEGGEEKATPVTFKAAYTGPGNVVYCVAAYAGNVDRDNDRLERPTLVSMARDFMKASKREINANHSTANKGEPIDCDVVESVTGSPILASGRTLKYGEEIPDDDPVTGIDLKGDPIVWIAAIEVHDPAIVELVKSGAIIGTSWEALVKREEC
jgi:hypothetical protein